MTKLIIQIPCYNEEKTLPATFVDLPKQIEGIDEIEVLIINDGSSDKTVEVAKALGVHHVVSFIRNRGLAKAFQAGIERSLKEGADIIVNTDADNQYSGKDIEKLVRPVLEKQADVVVGDRQTDTIKHFSKAKRRLQKIGSSLVRNLSGTNVKDAVSGFRAYSRETAILINVLSDFSYTIENLIQLGFNKLKIISVPVGTNEKTRESRLFKGIFHFLSQQLSTIIRIYSTYKSLRVFSILGVLFILPSLFGFGRFIYFYFTEGGDGHVQSLVMSTAFFVVGFLIILFGVIADLISNNRKLLEKLLQINKEDKWKK